MTLETKATKTYSDFINENPGMFDSMREFAWNEEEQRYIAVQVKDVTKKLISDWFSTRIVCNDNNFERFLSRQFNVCALRYSQLSRIELSAFDPLVADYMEREAINNNNKTSSNSREGNKSNASTTDASKTQNTEQIANSTRTPDITRADTSERISADNSNDSNAGSGNTKSTDKAMNKIAPMSISYGSTVGALPDLDWSYASAQDQKENVSNSSTTATNTHAGNSTENYSNTNKETGTDKNAANTTNTMTDIDKYTMAGSENSKESGTNAENGHSNDREVRAGRGGLTPQEAFRTAASYLKTSSAWEWFRSQLEECFLSVYDI